MLVLAQSPPTRCWGWAAHLTTQWRAVWSRLVGALVRAFTLRQDGLGARDENASLSRLCPVDRDHAEVIRRRHGRSTQTMHFRRLTRCRAARDVRSTPEAI